MTQSNCIFAPIIEMMQKQYPAKILVAWAEAISGNGQIRDWLTQNGYPELGVFVFALHNKEDAQQWLMQNGFSHLSALINGAEGNQQAQQWLLHHGFEDLYLIAQLGDNEMAAFHALKSKGQNELAMVGLRIQAVKNEIETNNSDAHRISKD